MKFTILLLALCILQACFASDEVKPVKVPAESQLEPKVENTEPARPITSKEIRKNKKFSLESQLFGYGYETQTQGFTAGYFIKEGALLHLSYLDLKKQFYSEEDRIKYSNVSSADWDKAGKGYVVEFGIRQYSSNAGYGEFSIYRRKQQSLKNTFLPMRSADAKFLAEIDDLGVILKIGHQWQWEYFNIGCDWIGFSARLANYAGQREDGKDAPFDLLDLTFLNFKIGYAF